MDSSERIRTRFARDLSTKTADEIRAEWVGPQLAALQKVSDEAFDLDAYLEDHNPIYFLAKRVWFDNDLHDPKTGYNDLLYPPFHRDQLCRELLDHYFSDKNETSGKIILAQRDSFKTTFCHGVFPQFISIREKYVNGRDVRIALVHHKEKMASGNLILLKQKSYQSQWFRQVWPEFCDDKDFGTSLRFNWPCKERARQKESSVVAFGLGAAQTGDHYDWMLLDDIVTEEHTKSKAVREDAFFRYNAGRFMVDSKTGKELLSGTLYHVNDLWAKLRKSGNYQELHIRAGGKHADAPLSLPNRHTQPFLDRKLHEYKSANQEVMYWLQYQLEPKSGSLVATDASWLKEIDLDDVPMNETTRWIIVDPAWKGTKNSGEGDDAAIVVIAMRRNNQLIERYLLDAVISNELTANDGEREIFRLMERWFTTNVSVEEIGGRTFRGMIEQSALAHGKFLNLVDLESQNKNKMNRIVNFIKHVEAGNFYIVKTCPQKEKFVDQFIDFPQCDPNDFIDAVAYSCDNAIIERHAPQWNPAGDYMYANIEPEPPRTRYCGV